MLFSTILVLISSGFAAAAGSPCSSIPYKELLFLSAYPPAESFCLAHYPLPTKTVTTTFTAPVRRLRRVPEPEPTPAPLAPLGGAAWSSLVAKGGSFVKTFCSCIETQPTVTSTVTTTPSPTCAYPSSTIAPAPCLMVLGQESDSPYINYNEFASYQEATEPLGGSSTQVAGDSSTAPCDAIQSCANGASGLGPSAGFVVAFHTDLNQWICQLHAPTTPSFTVTDCNIKAAYGYKETSSG